MRHFVNPTMHQPESHGAFTVTFPDFPEAITSGRNRADALTEAEDCLQEAIAGRMVRKEDIPAASRPKRGQAGIPVALYLAPKLALCLAMREKRINNSELARRLEVTENDRAADAEPKARYQVGKPSGGSGVAREEG